MSKGRIFGASIGNCIHIVSLMKFLSRAENEGFDCTLLGAGVGIRDLVEVLQDSEPDWAVISYRLTPEVGHRLFEELRDQIEKIAPLKTQFIVAGTPPVLEVGASTGIFEFGFSDADASPEIEKFLHPERNPADLRYQDLQILSQRIKYFSPFPLIRHHFGLPSLKETVNGARIIAESGVVDILSIGPDQNCQESFFRPDEIDEKYKGAGGVPIRSEEDFKAIYAATRCGSYPLVRSYAGTRDLVAWGELLERTINIAWGAVPLMMYSELDGRSDRPLKSAIEENQAAIRWYARNDIPVEVNESHQWALRFTSDIIEVAIAYIASYNAKKMGVKEYVMQYMLNTPPGVSPVMDLAKMFAKRDLVESLHDNTFTSYRMVRTGLASLSSDLDIAKGQLASSITIGMALNPHIVHVVGYSEGDHAATPEEVIESCKIIRGAIKSSLLGIPDMTRDEAIVTRKEKILTEVGYLIESIKVLGEDQSDPLTNPEVLARAVRLGLLDAPLLKGVKCASGKIMTKIVNGSSCTIDPLTKKQIDERTRVIHIMKENSIRERLKE